MQNSALQQASLYNDLNQINRIKVDKGNTQAGLQAVAEQFESIFFNQMMQAMRQAERVWSKDNPFHSQEAEFYQDMLDNQMSMELSQGPGIGIADMLMKQLGRFVKDPKVLNDKDTEDKILDEQTRLDEQEPYRAQSANIEIEPESSQAIFNGPVSFIQDLLPIAQEVAEKIGVDPKLLVAQAALETGWGDFPITTESGKNTHNLFGIKEGSRWQGETTNVHTHEYLNDKKELTQDKFRVYSNYVEAFDDYVALIGNNPRYDQAKAMAFDSRAYLTQLQAAGYATDPDYAAKVMRILASDHFNTDS